MAMCISSLMLIVLTILLFPAEFHAQTLGMHDNHTDQLSLLAFKTYITSDPNGVLRSWNSNIFFCNWRGVHCNIMRQRITSLDLRNLGISGTISPHIGNLSFLSALHLGGNSFSRTIPQEIGHLFRLKVLNLSSNHLEGLIPMSLGFCTSLAVIDLSSNKLQGKIPFELSNLVNLENLDFQDNFLTGPIPPFLGNLSLLSKIVLTQNNLIGEIPYSLGNLPLLSLNLGLNNLTGEIPPSIFNRSSLMILQLVQNRISGTLPSDMFTRLNNLVSLSIGGNQFSGHIPRSLGNASNLVLGDFGINNFTGKIPSLWNLSKIEILSFHTNQLVSDGRNGWDFLTSLVNSTQLQVLHLGQNLLTGELPASVGNLSRQLSELFIELNNIEGSLPSEISNLVGLNLFSAANNSINGNIPSSIGYLPNLQRLHLSMNNFSGEIPQSLGNLSSLSILSLQDNSLRGTIPISLGNLEHLLDLDLQNNMLSGTIPVEIFNIPKSTLHGLFLSNNLLDGQIPEQIGNLKIIQVLDLSSNRLTGNIPPSLGDCSSLQYLNLSRNSFRGQIPSTLANMKGVEDIDLSLNNLSGEIPVSLDSLVFLQVLDLSMNQLQGPVPLTGVFINATVVSLFGNHRLCGGIPELKLLKCGLPNENHVKRSKIKLITGLVVGLFGFFLIFTSLLYLLLSRKRSQQSVVTSIDDVFPHEGKYPLHTYYDIKSATGNFSPQSLIGRGSFGSVYKATFTDGSVVAVKVFDLEQQGAANSFTAECKALRNIRHRNLVKIISVCSSENFKALILPFMLNGSLDQWLHDRSQLEAEEGGLDLRQRMKIIKEVASAMEYLHYGCETPIVHCDLKPSNVLLNEDMCSHVADFGIARILNAPTNTAASSTLGLKGSIGYIAPEYGLGGEVSMKGDVYSFGMLLLEMFTGRRPSDEEFTGKLDLQGWVAKYFPHNIAHILDQGLIASEWNSNYNDCMINIFDIGLRCVTKSPDVRPTMREVSSLVNNVFSI